MRTRRVGLMALLPFAVALSGAQTGKTTQEIAAERRAAGLLAELSKASYAAKRPMPASEDIFVEAGQVIEPVFALMSKERPVAIPAGDTVLVSKVLFLDKALHIYFADDKCAILVLTNQDKLIKDLTPQQLLDLARKGIAALFYPVARDKPVS